MHFPVRRGQFIRRVVGQVHAVDGVSLTVRKGEIYGLVGESGCGKTTLARTVLKLVQPTSGDILFDGREVTSLERQELKRFRRRVQAVFQDPFSSLNPRMTVRDTLKEPYIVHQVEHDDAAIAKRIGELLDVCGLPRRLADRYPHEMSGGQRQRVSIARALALKPDLIVCDEAVSALDVSVQAQIVNLLEELRSTFGLTFLFIAHDLGIVRHLCQRVGVMYLGHLVEEAESDRIFERPAHPYTKALLTAVPIPDPEVEVTPGATLQGEVPSPVNPPSGCVFRTRCPITVPACAETIPPDYPAGPKHRAACLRIAEPVTTAH